MNTFDVFPIGSTRHVQRQCIWRPNGDPQQPRCAAMFTPRNTNQQCCLNHGVVYQSKCDRVKKLLRGAAVEEQRG